MAQHGERRSSAERKDSSSAVFVQPGLAIGKHESNVENLHRLLIYAFSRAFHKQVEMNMESKREPIGDNMSLLLRTKYNSQVERPR